MKLLAVTALVALAFAGIVLGSSVQELQQELNELSNEIEHAVQQKRAENSDAILATNNYVLTLMGNETGSLRAIVANKREQLEVERWLQEVEAGVCFDEAFSLWDTYAYLTGWDISWCAVVAYEETNADAQYTFYSHAQTIVREATRALNQATEAFGAHQRVEDQLEYLEQELDYLRFLWGNYQNVLQSEIDGHAVIAEGIINTLRVCFEGVYSDVEYWFNYLDNTLESCIDSLE
uniref:Protein TsetseEP domain-containing protein n=1 Tax=Anopheles atroparvus TaxID=41427 RepID=A0A182IV86_ANOAO